MIEVTLIVASSHVGSYLCKRKGNPLDSAAEGVSYDSLLETINRCAGSPGAESGGESMDAEGVLVGRLLLLNVAQKDIYRRTGA